MKPLSFLGDSLKCLRAFPEDAKQDAGYQLDKAQQGQQPDDFKPMPSVGKGVEELRIWDEHGTFLVIYLARLPEAVFVLHGFRRRCKPPRRRTLSWPRSALTI
jgi:phage-related protein